MCGIAGVFEVDGAPVATGTVRAMTTAIAHRGPDGAGHWTDPGIGIGHRRLAILDLSDAAAQPMHAGDRYVLAFNGEIYNWRELRRELEHTGVRFRTRSDTEVLLAAWIAWGEEVLPRLNGMFAFAVYDRWERRLVLVRDRYGIKPLYYAWDGRRLLFGSEIKALLAHGSLAVRVDPDALQQYFTFQNVFTDQTLFGGVRLLPRATLLEVTQGSAHSFATRTWWDYTFRDGARASAAEYEEELDRLFRQAVARQASADVEVGTYLSGGIDSGAVTCLAAQQHPHVKSFTAGFDLSSASGLELAFDERAKAEALSTAFRTEHYQVVLKAGDMERVLPQLVRHLEDLRVGQSYPNFYIARLASRFVKVVLAGTGGDELFAGYPWRYYRAVGSADANSFAARYFGYWQRLVPDGVRRDFLRPSALAGRTGAGPEAAFRDVLARHPIAATGDGYVNASLYFELSTFLHGLLLVEDKLSMAHGLETRLPFLDNDLVDFALGVPVAQKLRHVDAVRRLDENVPGPKTEQYYNTTGDGKLILRRTLARYLPPSAAFGPKQGFSAPDASWFKGDSIRYIRRLLIAPDARIHDYVDPATSRLLLEDHFAGRTNHRLLIWSLLCFEWWLREFAEGGAVALAA